jgi:hypothetical protein
MRRRRGFTLIELCVYLSLVSSALLVFGGIELSARRSLSVQSALIDMENQASSYLGALRRDVEASTAVDVKADTVLVHKFDGSGVVYRAGERRELDPAGKERVREVYPLLGAIVATQAGSRVSVEARFSVELGWAKLERTFSRGASPRREVSDGK